MTVHSYRSRQVCETLNGVNPSSGFRDMRSAKSGPNLWQIFFGSWASPYGKMGKWAWQCTTTGLDNSIDLRTEKIHQAVTEIWVPQVWQPPARTVTTIPLQPGGLRGKNCSFLVPKFKNINIITRNFLQIISPFNHNISERVPHFWTMFLKFRNGLSLCNGLAKQNGRHFSDDIYQPFSWMKMLEVLLKFHWSLFLRVKLTIFQHWFR